MTSILSELSPIGAGLGSHHNWLLACNCSGRLQSKQQQSPGVHGSRHCLLATQWLVRRLSMPSKKRLQLASCMPQNHTKQMFSDQYHACKNHPPLGQHTQPCTHKLFSCLGSPLDLSPCRQQHSKECRHYHCYHSFYVGCQPTKWTLVGTVVSAAQHAYESVACPADSFKDNPLIRFAHETAASTQLLITLVHSLVVWMWLAAHIPGTVKARQCLHHLTVSRACFEIGVPAAARNPPTSRNEGPSEFAANCPATSFFSPLLLFFPTTCSSVR